MAQLPAVLARQGLQIVSNLTPGGFLIKQESREREREREKLINKGKKTEGENEEK